MSETNDTLTVTNLEQGTLEVDLSAIPDELTERDQWLNWDAAADRPRRPCIGEDFGVAWSDPDDWLTFEEAVDIARNKATRGIGFVFANTNDDHARGLYGCLDIDGCYDDDGRAADWVPSMSGFYRESAFIERSPSGQGLHVPLVGFEPPDWWRDVEQDEEHTGVEAYGSKFMTVTGDRLREAGWELAEAGDWVDRWLREAHKSLTGEDPVNTSLSGDSSASGSSDGWLEEEDVREALSHLDPDCAYPLWRDIGFALMDHFGDEQQALAVYRDWSSSGTKWDAEAERIIEDADPTGERTIGTVIHHATEQGWEPPAKPDSTPEPAPAPDEQQDRDENAPGWETVYGAYLEADDADERRRARYRAVQQLDATDHWRNVVETDHLWHWDGGEGRYRRNGDTVVRETLVTGLRDQFKEHEVNETVTQLQGRHSVREDEMGGPAGAINCQNGVIRINPDGTVAGPEPADPDDNWLTAIETSYEPDAECPQFREFLEDAVPEGSDRKKLQEFAGYALMHWALPYHKALFLVGPTASGKSTFLDTIRALLGERAVASLTPQEMTAQRFAGAELYGAWANIRNDIPAEMIENTGTFKELVAGDPVKAEQKFEDPFFFEPTAKHMFSANRLPSAETDDEAFYRRILLAAFPSTVPRDQRDPSLDDKLQRELPGVLNWALDGLQRLMDEQGFTGDRRPGQTAETWQQWGDPVGRFASVCLEDGEQEIAKAELFQAFLDYCEDEGIPAETRRQFTRALKSEGFRDGRAYVDGAQQRVFTGIDVTSRGAEYLGDTSDDGARDQRRLD